jgi:hypothetical protein
MNAMLEPRIVAASIQGFDVLAHGSPESADRSTASSQGCLMHSLDARLELADSN